LKYRVIQNWANLHGIISLYKSHILYETATNDKEILKRCIDDQIERIRAYAEERAMEKLVPRQAINKSCLWEYKPNIHQLLLLVGKADMSVNLNDVARRRQTVVQKNKFLTREE